MSEPIFNPEATPTTQTKNKYFVVDANVVQQYGHMPVKTQYNAYLFPKDYEVNTQPSMTVPDQSMTIKEILERNSRGLSISGNREPIYHGEEWTPDLAKMDLSEIYDLKDNIQEAHRTYQDYLQDMKNEKTKQLAAKYQEEQKELAELRKLKQQRNESSNP